MKFTLLVIAVLLVGCSGGTPPAPTGPESASSQPPSPSVEHSAWKAECVKCLESGNKFSGGQCAGECMMDTWCFTPSDSCPDTEPETDPNI